MRILALISLFLLVACGPSDEAKKNLTIMQTFKPNPYEEHKIILVGTEGVRESLKLPLRSYQNYQPDIHHLISDNKPNLRLIFKVEGPYFSSFNCKTRYNYPDKNLSFDEENGTHTLKINSSLEIKTINLQCDYLESDEEKEYEEYWKIRGKPSSIKEMSFSYKVIVLPSTPIELDYELLNSFGYSPYNNFSNTDEEVNRRFNYLASRDIYNLGFVNRDQSGITFFWDSRGFTNITFGECPPAELRRKLEELGSFRFKPGTGRWAVCGSLIRK
tara:strand:- start:307 stop:1125 length:819 start_codon:yes stop_codon:yes gene_type:complete